MNTEEKLESLIGTIIAVHDNLADAMPPSNVEIKLSAKMARRMIDKQLRVINASCVVLMESLMNDCPDEFMKVKGQIEEKLGKPTKH